MTRDSSGNINGEAIAGVDLERLAHWMRRQGLGAGEIESVRPIGGGTQNIMLHVDFCEHDYVLRRPPLHLRENSNATMSREVRLLAALAGSKVPHPPLVAACEDETVLGAVFYLCGYVDGFNARETPPALHATSAKMRRQMGFALVDGIAALAALDYRALGLAGFGKPDDYLGRQIDRWRSQLASYGNVADWTGPDKLLGLDAVTRWLAHHIPAGFAPGIMHGDYHLANVLFRRNEPALAAIIDWELATIGDPLVDLGWLLATCWAEQMPGSGHLEPVWPDFPSPAALVERYATQSSRDLSAILWYIIFACFKLAILLEGTHARACAGNADRSTGDQLHAKAIELLRRAQLWIEAESNDQIIGKGLR